MKNKRKNLSAICLLLIAAMLFAAGCGEKPADISNNTTAPSTVTPEIPGDDALKLLKGGTMTLTPQSLTGEIQWSSSAPELASVDEQGVITAHSDRGNVTVTAKTGDGEESWKIYLCQQTDYGMVSLPTSDDDIVIGVWNGSYHKVDEFRMELLADAGISLLIGLEEKWLATCTMEEMLDLAQSYGISILEDMRDWDGETIPEYTDHPALLGYLMFDEPNTVQYEKLRELKEKYDLVMPEDKLFYVNLFPMACSYESLYGDPYDMKKTDYEQYYIDTFVEMMDLPYISYDAYALQLGDVIRPSYYENFDIVSHACQETGRDFWYTLLSSGHSTTDGRYITPGAEELRWQMMLAMAYGSRDLAHYVLCSHDSDYEAILSYGDWSPTDLYDSVSIADNEVLAWDDIYTHYVWKGTAQVDVGEKNPMLTCLTHAIPLSQAGTLTEVSSNEDLLVGVFEGSTGNAYMIANAGSATEVPGREHLADFAMQDANVVLQLKEGSYQCAAVICRGEITYLPVSADNTVSLTIGAYDGAFVIPLMK